MRTFILVKRDNAGHIVDLAGPCTERDSNQLDDLAVEKIDELLFRVLHPEDYKQLLQKDLTPAVYAWVDQFYENKVELILENNAIITENFTIFISPAEVQLMIHGIVSTAEIANLVLHLRNCIFEDIPVNVTECQIFEPFTCN